MRSSGVHPFDHVLITKGSALENEKQLREAKEDFHLLGDAIESLKKDVHRLKNKTVSYLSEDKSGKLGAGVGAAQDQGRGRSWDRAQGFQSTASAVLTPELRSLKRIIEKFMTVTEREQRKDTLAKAQLATTKASQGLNRVNELETENTVLRRKIN